MERNIFEKQRELNDRLNRYRDEYYNRNAPSVSDEVYDRLFDELKELEQETGIQMANSPTQTVGYPAVSRLEKTRHEIPLLSLDKTKSSMDLLNFMGEQQIMLMLKLDGLTVKLTYENGELLEAATRGDGDEGEIITHNTRAISGIPSHITYKERLVVTGEGFIRPSDFEELKAGLQDSNGKPYKNGRNLAAGSIRLMDAKTCQERRLVFMPFGVLEGFPHLTRKSDKLRELRALGFQPCKYLVTKQKLTLENVEAGIYQLRQYATDKDIPIDGIVVSFNDIAYEGDVDAILMGKKTKYPEAAIRLTEQMTQEFISDLFSTLRERMIDLQYCKVVFVGGGAILLKRQIETAGKVGAPFFVPKINANADGYEYLYRIETAGR